MVDGKNFRRSIISPVIVNQAAAQLERESRTQYNCAIDLPSGDPQPRGI
jgi:hypothetical protein